MSDDVLRPKLTRYKIMEIEDALFASRADLPNWKLADKARRLLIDALFQITASQPAEPFETVAEIPAPVATRIAVNHLAGITVRVTGSAMAMLACGYELEAVAPARRGLEAKLRARAVLADESGQHAREWLANRPQGGLTKLAQKYGNPDDGKWFSIFAHADSRGLNALHVGEPLGDGEVQPAEVRLQPGRDPTVAGVVLHGLAYEAVEMASHVALASREALMVPPWIINELTRLRDDVNAALADE